MRTALVVVLLPRLALAQTFVDHADFDPVTEPAPNSMGGGAAFLDWNGDGFLDVLVAHGHRGVFLYENEGPPDFGFHDVTLAANLPDTMTAAVGGAAADLDRDGDPDLVVADYAKTWMFENAGTHFVDVTDEALPGLPWFPAMATFADVDGDGWTDVHLPGYTLATDWPYHDCAPDMLLRNRGDGTFEDVARAAGVDDPGCTLAALFSDYDLDGDPDLFTANDFGTFLSPNRLYRNDGLRADGSVTFTDVSESSGAMHRLYGMGLATADVDENGFPDYFGTSIGRSVLLLGGPDGTFEDATETWGVESALGERDWRATWGCAFLDAENDGAIDLAVSSGWLSAAAEIRNGIGQPNLFFSGLRPDARATDRAAALDIAPFDENHGLAIGDFDRDGDDDVLTSSTDGEVHLYRNDLGAGPAVSVVLHGTVSNPDALGARVSLSCAGTSRAREVVTGGSFGSGHSPVVTLPLAGCEAGGDVVVRWPSGLVERIPVDGGGGTLDRTEPEWITIEPAWLPADGAATATVTVVPNDDAGAPLGPGHLVTVTASAGSIGPVSDLGDGTYDAILSADVVPGESALTIEIDGERQVAHPRARFFAGDRTTLHASPDVFVAGATFVRLTAVPRDAAGVLAGPGHVVTFDVLGATADGGVSDSGDGRYGITVVGDGGAPIEARVRIDGILRGPAVTVPEIVAIDPARSSARLVPGWVPASVGEEDVFAGRPTYVSILAAPRDGRGGILPDASAIEYALDGEAGPLVFERLPRSGGVSLRIFARVLLEAGDVVVRAAGIPIATVRLEPYASDDDLFAAVDPGRSRIAPYLESAYADGQDYAWIEAQLRDADDDSIPFTEAFSFASDEMSLVETRTFGGGEEGKARMRAGAAAGTATIDVTYAGDALGLSTQVTLLPPKTRDLDGDRIRACIDDTAREAEGAGDIKVEVMPLDPQGFLLGSGYPLRLWVDAVPSPLDYAEPGGLLGVVPVPAEPGITEVAVGLDGTDRGARLAIEFLAKDTAPVDPDRPHCADLEHGFVPPEPDADAGPDAGEDAGVEDASTTPHERIARGSGCTCDAAGSGAGLAILPWLVVFWRRRAGWARGTRWANRRKD